MSSQSFSYRTLIESDEIRVLVLCHGSDSSPIVTKLKHVRLRDFPEYEALSYAWGSPSKEYGIEVDGAPVKITESLYSALRNLRHTGRLLRRRRDRVIWADALCINQGDDVEKSQQVAMMAKIYSMSSSTIIWLGEDPYNEAKAACEMICKVDKFLCKHADNYRVKLSEDQVGYRDSHVDEVEMSKELVIKLAAMDLETISPLLAHFWYHRLWVVQEAVLSGEPVLYFGKEKLYWTVLGAVADAFLSLDVSSYVEFRMYRKTLERISTIYSIQENMKQYFEEGTELGILDLIDNTGEFACSDPRDEIFALLSLAETDGLRPDYSQSVTEVYIGFTQWALLRHDHLEALSYAGLAHRTHLDAYPEIPSWALSPSSIREGCTFVCAKHLHAASESLDQSDDVRSMITINGKSLVLQGMLLDTIHSLGAPLCSEDRRPHGSLDVRDTMPHGDEWKDWIISTLELASPNYTSLAAEKKHKLYRAMFCDLDPNGAPADPEAHIWFEWFLDDFDNESRTKQHAVEHNDETDLIDVSIGRFAIRRRFCVTSRGHYAWVPEITELSDEIFVIRGAKVPFVMRRTTGSLRELVGEAWVQDFMDGELLREAGSTWSTLNVV